MRSSECVVPPLDIQIWHNHLAVALGYRAVQQGYVLADVHKRFETYNYLAITGPESYNKGVQFHNDPLPANASKELPSFNNTTH